MKTIEERAKEYMCGNFKGPFGSYIKGATDQREIDLKELVHKPDNKEGITAQELEHQIYGYNFGVKKTIQSIKDRLTTMQGEYITLELINELANELKDETDM